MDENVAPKNSPIYLGIWFTSSLIGPGLGFLVGGNFLRIWTDLKLVSIGSLFGAIFIVIYVSILSFFIYEDRILTGKVNRITHCLTCILLGGWSMLKHSFEV